MKNSSIIFITSTTGKIKSHLIPEIENYYNKLGYSVIFGPSCSKSRSLNVKDDLLRAKEINTALKNPLIHAIIFARGGEYSKRLIPHLDYEIVKNSEKIIIGFSDLTSIMSFLCKNSNVKVYHGPMAVDSIVSTQQTTRQLKKILKNEPLSLTLPKSSILNEGNCEGILQGGCISVLAKLLNTKHLPDFNNSILFLEDIHETVTTLKGIINQFYEMGKLNTIKGLIFGEMYHCGYNQKHFWDEFSPFLDYLFKNSNIPVAYNVPSGHGKNSIYLPFGRNVKLSLAKRKSSLIEISNSIL